MVKLGEIVLKIACKRKGKKKYAWSTMTVISWQRRRVRCVDHVMGWKGRIKLGHERGVWYCIVAANLYRRGSKTGSRGEGIGMHLSLELTFSKCRFGLLGICHYDGRLLPRSGNSCVR